ncbi:MAG: NAD(P)(+) transhydrogenase (Re/Si-specific) subunit alpha, partial [Desulfamplus sp.]|nr:NAD(P)(+) transhydrogenase (Re/Si-specific) subunit alpha [Desulfamplus sp.]
MLIGIPKEILSEENRVAATPDTVKKFIALGFKVAVESSAGKGIMITDDDYINAGAEIISDTEALFEKSDLVLKVKQPEFNSKTGKHEADMIRDGSMLITFIM